MDTARQLTERLASLYRNERNAMADFLIALAGFDQRRVWLELGYASLWAYLRHELQLSKSAAFQRKTAAELIQAHPAVAEALRSGDLCLSTITELARVLTPGNAAEVLPRFFGLSYKEAESLAASLRPRAVIPTRDVVKVLPPSVPGVPDRTVAPASPPSGPSLPVPDAVPELTLAPAVPTSEPGPSTPEPLRPERALTASYLDADRARISVTVPRRVLDKLEAAKDALAHAIPDGNLAEVLEHALDLVLKESKRKRGQVERPRKASRPPKEGSRHVPAEVARAVWNRSGGRCECTLPDGSRCNATRALELDHVRPFALGGRPTEDNVRVACRGCNQLAARRAFGDEVVDHYARRRGGPGKVSARVETGRPGPPPLPPPHTLALPW